MCLFYETQQHNRMHSYGQQSWRKLPNSGPEDPSVWKPIHRSHFDMAGCLQKPSSPSVTDLSHTRAQLAMCGPVWSKNKLSSDFFSFEVWNYGLQHKWPRVQSGSLWVLFLFNFHQLARNSVWRNVASLYPPALQQLKVWLHSLTFPER